MSFNKSYAVFGLGRYGFAVAKELADCGAEIVAVDKDENLVNDAIDYILDETGCYPYFIQQYGKLLWKTVPNNKIITKTDAEIIKEEYRETLNNGFFGSRYNRATNKEKEFLYAMVECGRFPCSMTDVAIKMNKNVNITL